MKCILCATINILKETVKHQSMSNMLIAAQKLKVVRENLIDVDKPVDATVMLSILKCEKHNKVEYIQAALINIKELCKK